VAKKLVGGRADPTTPLEGATLPVVLCVDDEPDIRRVLRHVLELAGFTCAEAGSGQAALEWVAKHGLPHVAIVDIRMPGMSGLELCDQLHGFSDLPVILLTAVDDEPTIVRSIETVAEDYVLKPFQPAVVVARIKRLLRRTGGLSRAQGPLVRIDDRLSVCFQRQEAHVEGAVVPLTMTETKLLYVLLRGSPRSVRNAQLLSLVWPREELFEDTLRVHVHRLRQKLEPDPSRPRYLVTDRGIGYRFVVPGAAAE
jgi:DNA-binding response OmpR family regulator